MQCTLNQSLAVLVQLGRIVMDAHFAFAGVGIQDAIDRPAIEIHLTRATAISGRMLPRMGAQLPVPPNGPVG